MNNIFLKLGFSTLIQAIGKIISLFISLTSVALLTRYLGVSSYGNYSLVFAYLSFFGAISDVGLNVTVINEINKKTNFKKLAATYFWLKIATSLASFIVPVCLLIFFPYPSFQKTAIAIGALAFGVGNMAGFGNTFLQSKLKLGTITLVDLVGRFVTLVFTFFFIMIEANLFFLVSAVLIGNIVLVGLNFILTRKELHISLKIEKEFAIGLIKTSLPIGMATLLSFFYFRVDTIMLSIIKGAKDVGVYSLSYKIFENVLIFWAFYITAFYPLFAKYHSEGKRESYISLFKASIRAAIILSFIILLVGVFLSGFLVRVIAGPEFVESATPLKILLMSSGLFFINAVLYYFIFIKNETKILLKSLVFSLIFNVLINLLLIPKYSYTGASVTTFLTELFLLIFYIYQIRKISF